MEYKTSRRKAYSRSKLVLSIGIILVILAISFSLLSSVEYYENKTVGNTESLIKDKITPINIEESYGLGYSYIISGELKLNSTKPVYLFYGNQSQYVINSTILDLRKSELPIYIQAIFNDTKLTYYANYTVQIRPYLALSIPSLFFLIIGAVFSFMGLYQYLLIRREFS